MRSRQPLGEKPEDHIPLQLTACSWLLGALVVVLGLLFICMVRP
jgi:TorA maturation chaperone TorD